MRQDLNDPGLGRGCRDQAKGRLRGKQPKLSPKQEALLVQLWRDGTHTTLDLTELFEVARSTGYRTIQRAGLLTGLIARGRRLGHIALPEPGLVPLTVRPGAPSPRAAAPDRNAGRNVTRF